MNTVVPILFAAIRAGGFDALMAAALLMVVVAVIVVWWANRAVRGAARAIYESEGRARRQLSELEAIYRTNTDITERNRADLVLQQSDLTQERSAAAALRQSEQRYRELFNSIDEGFCVIEMIFDEEQRPVDYKFVEVNPAFARQTGLVDACGKRMRELAPEHEQHWFDIYGKVAKTGESVRFPAAWSRSAPVV